MIKPSIYAVALLASLAISCASSPPPARTTSTASPAATQAQSVSEAPEAAAPQPMPASETPPPADAVVAPPASASPAPVARTAPARASTPAAPSAPSAPARASTPAAGSGAAYTGPNPCTHALGSSGIIDQACGRGGIKEAKVVMKDMVKKAKKQGMKVDCDTCHKDDTDWAQFTTDAKERFKELLSIYQK